MAAAVRPVATGRPGTEVIPTGWAAGHQAAADGTKTARVALRLPGTTSRWDEASQSTVTEPYAPYASDVPARVQALANDARVITAAEQTVTVTGYLIAVPADLAPQRGHIVTVSGSGDPLLDGRELKVDDVVRGSLRFERDLYCSLS